MWYPPELLFCKAASSQFMESQSCYGWRNIWSHLDLLPCSIRATWSKETRTVSSWYQVCSGVWVNPLQDFTLFFVELHDAPISSFLQSVKVPLKGNTTFCSIRHSSRFCMICMFSEDAFCPVVQVFNEDVEKYWPKCLRLGYNSVSVYQLDFLPLITAS